jgi:hypothetical protein
MSTPPRKRLPIPRNRKSVTGETDDPGGRYTAAFPDSIGSAQQGGGSVPADLFWSSSPKQRQEEMTEENLRLRRLTPQAAEARRVAEARAKAGAALPAGSEAEKTTPALPAAPPTPGGTPTLNKG